MRRMFRRRQLWLAAAVSLVIAGCASGDQPRQRPQPRPRPPAVSPAPAAATADYFHTAASIDLFEVRSSQMALTRARNPRLREFAAMMVSAHNGTAAQLSLAGRRLNLLPSTILMPRHQVMLDELSRTGDFDFHYRRQQVNVHEEALRLHSSYAARGRSATLRPVAANAVPIVRGHLALLRAM